MKMNNYDPIETLMEEHKEGLKRLDILQNAVMELEESGFLPETYQMLLDSTKFINTEIRQHNEKEESALFPLLEKYLPDGPVAVMLEEHRLLWERLESLEKTLPHLMANPPEDEIIEQVSQDAASIVQLLQDHIAKENEVLYPMAKEFFNRTDWSEVEHKMAFVPV